MAGLGNTTGGANPAPAPHTGAKTKAGSDPLDLNVSLKPSTAPQEEQKKSDPVQEQKNKERLEYFTNLLNDNKKINLQEWIDKSGLKDAKDKDSNGPEHRRFTEELNKIERFCQEAFHGDMTWLKAQRAMMTGAWLITVGGLATMAVMAPAGLIVYAPLGLAVNMAVQKLCAWRHDIGFKSMFNEVSRELKNAGPMEAGIAWAGVMHHFLDQLPFYLRKGRTEFWNGRYPTSRESVYRQIKASVAYGAETILNRKPEDQKNTFFKDTKFNDYISQNDDAMKALEQRVLFFTKHASRLSNPFPLFKKFIFGK